MSDPYDSTLLELPPDSRPPWQTPWLAAAVLLLAALCLCLLVISLAAGANLFNRLDARQLSYSEIVGTAQATLRDFPPTTQVTQPPETTLPPASIPTAWPTAPPVNTITLTLTPTQTGSPQGRRTDPGIFIRDYYTLINERQYTNTFAMLSDNFKRRNHCCKPDGSFDDRPYKDWWNSIEKVEVLWVDVKKWEQDRAVVEIELRYHRMDGRVVDDRHTFTLVGDPFGKSWLID